MLRSRPNPMLMKHKSSCLSPSSCSRQYKPNRFLVTPALQPSLLNVAADIVNKWIRPGATPRRLKICKIMTTMRNHLLKTWISSKSKSTNQLQEAEAASHQVRAKKVYWTAAQRRRKGEWGRSPIVSQCSAACVWWTCLQTPLIRQLRHSIRKRLLKKECQLHFLASCSLPTQSQWPSSHPCSHACLMATARNESSSQGAFAKVSRWLSSAFSTSSVIHRPTHVRRWHVDFWRGSEMGASTVQARSCSWLSSPSKNLREWTAYCSRSRVWACWLDPYLALCSSIWAAFSCPSTRWGPFFSCLP